MNYLATALVVLGHIALAGAAVCLASGIYLIAAPNGRWTTWFRPVDADPVTNAELSAELGISYLASFAFLVLVSFGLCLVGRVTRWIDAPSSADG